MTSAVRLGTEMSSVTASPGFHVDAAPLLPAVVAALAVWDKLALEIGDAAVLTPGPWAPLLATVASWYGAKTLVVGGAAGDPDMAVTGSDAESVSRLTHLLADYPAVCAVELTGRADMVDLLLESVPRYSHVLFAGLGGDLLTIDYYVNVHRKGLYLASSVFAPSTAVDGTADRMLVDRAARLLMQGDRAAACEHAVAAAAKTR